MGENEFDELADFKAWCDEREKRPAKDRKRANRPDVSYIGAGPEPKKGPFCHLCHDPRRLVPDVLKLPDGRKVHLCRTCILQVKWDRARRCISCGSHTEGKLINSGGVCKSCQDGGIEAQHNLIELIKLRWVGVIRG